MSDKEAMHIPKETFFNLPIQKRGVIEQAALDEFSEYGFDNSNMNRIVAASGIAKGSFYQYFENKKDLYFHLMDTVVAQKMEAISPIRKSCRENDFKTNLRELVRLGLAFADKNPQLYRLGEDFARNNPALINEFTQKYTSLAEDIYGMILQIAKERGELREDADLPLAGMFISILMNQVIAVLLTKPKDIRDYIFSQMLDFIEHAVLNNTRSEDL